MTSGSPWFRAADQPEPEPGPIPGDPYAYGPQGPGQDQGQEYGAVPPPYGAQGTGGPAPAPYGTPHDPSYGTPAYGPPHGGPAYDAPYDPAYGTAPSPAPTGPSARSVPFPAGAPEKSPGAAPYEPVEAPRPRRARQDETTPMPVVEPLPGPGRAERRRAAAKGGRGARGKGRGSAPAAPSPGPGEGRPLSRVEARRAARAAKDSVGVIASRAVGELFITLGVVMLLFVTYQLWWTNVLAGQETNQAKERIEDTWAKGERTPGAFEPGEGFAIMYIPKLDVVVPIAEGIDKPKVLDKGMVGHYAEGSLKTAMPSDKQGNFAVAGHRNTHGEPFRYINQLKPGDPIVVETQDAYYTYEMASILPQTAPSNIAVIDPIPKGSGFTKPGRYITLTTCTPEFTSTYRMIVWGKMVEERPRSKGKPDALVG
ncbi:MULTISPECIES: class E sortase [unclassified Streptomyces]|uniref:class E sortase n=1 Tax=unclassified Streptomyces TaxID=2593676 RepID=UPI003694069A